MYRRTVSESAPSDGSASESEDVNTNETVTEENIPSEEPVVNDKFYLPQLEALTRFREATDTLQTLSEANMEVNSQFGTESDCIEQPSNVEFNVFSREEDNRSEESFGSSHSIAHELPPVQLRRYIKSFKKCYIILIFLVCTHVFM